MHMIHGTWWSCKQSNASQLIILDSYPSNVGSIPVRFVESPSWYCRGQSTLREVSPVTSKGHCAIKFEKHLWDDCCL